MTRRDRSHTPSGTPTAAADSGGLSLSDLKHKNIGDLYFRANRFEYPTGTYSATLVYTLTIP